MKLLYKLEKRFGKFAIPHLMNYIVILSVLGIFLGMVNPRFYQEYLILDMVKVSHGQAWRLVTFILTPEQGGVGTMSIFFIAIRLYLYYMIGNSLENAWGSFRFNLYYLSGILLNIVAAIIIQLTVQSSYASGLEFVNQSLFLAFATLFPNMQLLLFFVLPIKVKWLGIVYGGLLCYQVLTAFMTESPGVAIAIIFAMANFLIFFLTTRNYKKVSPKEYGRKKQFKKKIQKAAMPTRHKCCVCGRTEEDNPNLDFRYCSKCEGNYEYCSDHLFTHEHVHKH